MKTETGLLPVGLLRTVRGHTLGRGSGQLFDCSYGQTGGRTLNIEVLTDRGTSHGLRATGPRRPVRPLRAGAGADSDSGSEAETEAEAEVSARARGGQAC